MKLAAALALQSVPFAGFVYVRSEERDLFAVLYISALGVILTLTALIGDVAVDAADLAAITEALTLN